MKKNVVENGTKVVCQNCGAEIVIPNRSKFVVGSSIAKDSNLGTIELPTVPNTGRQICNNGCVVNQGYSVAQQGGDMVQSLIDRLRQDGNGALAMYIAELSKEIEADGHLEVQKIVRRWIPSQCLSMLNHPLGFHKLLSLIPYKYSWNVLIADLKRQITLAKEDKEEFQMRNLWYNKDIAVEMAKDYLQKLQAHLNRLPVKHYKSRPYKRLNYWENVYGVFVNEIDDLLSYIDSKIDAIKFANSPQAVHEAVEFFYGHIIKLIAWKPLSSEKSSAFVNAYKAAGAYYTMKDLILFEDCVLPELINDKFVYDKYECTQRSLLALDKFADKYRNGELSVSYDGYLLLGALKQMLKANNFDYEATAGKWLEDSRKRRQQRKTAVRRNR